MRMLYAMVRISSLVERSHRHLAYADALQEIADMVEIMDAQAVRVSLRECHVCKHKSIEFVCAPPGGDAPTWGNDSPSSSWD